MLNKETTKLDWMEWYRGEIGNYQDIIQLDWLKILFEKLPQTRTLHKAQDVRAEALKISVPQGDKEAILLKGYPSLLENIICIELIRVKEVIPLKFFAVSMNKEPL